MVYGVAEDDENTYSANPLMADLELRFTSQVLDILGSLIPTDFNLAEVVTDHINYRF